MNEFIDYLKDSLISLGTIKAKKMFGGYGIYCNNIFFAIFIDDDLYFKVDEALKKELEQTGSYPFTYYKDRCTS